MADSLQMGGTATPSASGSGLQVLLVAAAEEPIATLPRLFEDLDCRIAIAFDADSGQRALERFKPGLVVVDLETPGFDGNAVARRAAAFADDEHSRPVLIGVASTADAESPALAAGFDRVIVMPLVPGILAEVVAATRRQGGPRVDAAEASGKS